MEKLIEEAREARHRELEKRQAEKLAKKEKERDEERIRWKSIEDAKLEMDKEKNWLNEEKEKLRLAQNKNVKEKEEIDKLAKIWKDENDKKKEELKKLEDQHAEKLYEQTVE